MNLKLSFLLLLSFPTTPCHCDPERVEGEAIFKVIGNPVLSFAERNFH